MLRRLRNPALQLAAGFILLMALFSTAFVVSEGERMDESWVRHTLEVENRLAGLFSHIQDAEGHQRNYVIAGGDKELEAYGDARPAIARDLQALSDATRDNPVEQAAIVRLRPLIDQRLDALEAAISLQRRHGLPTAAAYIIDGHGRAVMKDVRRQLLSMQGEEDGLLRARAD